MTTISIKGHDIHPLIFKDSFQRQAVQFQNKIIEVLRKLDLTADDVEIELEPVSIKRAPASASWFFNGHYLHYSYHNGKYVDNLYVVYKVIEYEVNALISGKKTREEFIHEFSEDQDVKKQRQEARKTLGIPADCLDITVIDKAYKDMAKKLHPDVDGGDVEKFKTVNRAHKILKRELG